MYNSVNMSGFYCWRLLVTIFLFLCLNLGCCLANPSEYQVNQTYVYRYEGYVILGVPGFKDRFKGFQLNADVNLLRNEKNNFIASLIEPKYRRVDDSSTPEDPFGGQKLGNLSKLVEWWLGNRKQVAKMLALPIRFKWQPGRPIEGIDTVPNDVYWSINLKKGLLAILSASFNQIKTLNKTTRTYSTKYEDNPEGLCNSDYIVLERKPDFGKRKNIDLLRQRDLTSCKSPVSFDYSSFPPPTDLDTENGPPWEPNKEIRAVSETRYSLTQTPNSVFINQAFTNSRYMLIGSDNLQQSPGALSRQELVFKFQPTRNDTKKTEDIRWKKNKGGLSIFLPSTMNRRRRANNDELSRQIGILLRDLGFEPRYNGVVESRRLIELVYYLRRLSINDLMRVYRSTRNRAGRRLYLLDALAATGTRQAYVAIESLFLQSKISDEEFARLLQRAALSPLASRELLLVLNSLSNTTLSPRLRQAVWYVAGIVYRRLPSLTAEARAFFSNTSGLASPELTLLGAVGNTGFPDLQEIILSRFDASQSIPVRLTALRSWRRSLASQLPGRTRRLLFPVVAASTEPVEVRVEAFLCLMQARPTWRNIASLAAVLQREPLSSQLRQFVLSYSQANVATRGKSGTYAREILRRLQLPLTKWGLLGSRTVVLTKGGRQSMKVVASIVCGEDDLPRQITLEATAEVGERRVALWTVFLWSPDIGPTLANFFGPGAPLWGLNWVQKLWNELQRQPKQSTAPPSKQKSSIIAISLYGADYISFLFNGSAPTVMMALKDIFVKARGKLDAWAQIFKFEQNHLFDSSLHFTSSIGVRLTVNRTLAYTISSELEAHRPDNSQAMYIQATATQFARLALGVESGLAEISVIHDTYDTLMPARRRFFSFAIATSSSNAVLSVFPIDPRVKYPLLVAESAADTFYCVNGKSYYKPNRRPLRLGLEAQKSNSSRRWLGGLWSVQSDRWLLDSRRPWTPYRTEWKVDLNAARWGNRNGARLYINITDLNDLKRSAPPKRSQERILERFFNSRAAWMIPSATSAGEQRWRQFAVSARLTSARMDISLRRIRVEQEKLVASLAANASAVATSAVLSLVGGAAWSFNASIYRTGADARFNPAQPLSVTPNARLNAIATFASSQRILVQVNASLTRTTSWAKAWSDRLKYNTNRLPYTIRRCVYDSLAASMYGPPRNPNAPSCYRAWRILDSPDNAIIQISPPMPGLATYLQPFFSSMEVKDSGSELVGSLRAQDRKTLAARQQLLELLDAGGSFKRRCEVLVYRKRERRGLFDAAPRRILVEAFDGRLYAMRDTTDKPVMLLASKGSQNFTVRLFRPSRWDDRKDVQVNWTVGENKCSMNVPNNKRRGQPRVTGGSICVSEFRLSQDTTRGRDGWRVEFPLLRLTVLSATTNTQRSVTIWVSPLAKVNGICSDGRRPCVKLPCKLQDRLDPDNGVSLEPE